MQLSGGKFHSGSRTGLESRMGTDIGDIKEDMSKSDRALHQQQIMASLTDAATAGAVKGGGDWIGDLFGGAEVAKIGASGLPEIDGVVGPWALPE